MIYYLCVFMGKGFYTHFYEKFTKKELTNVLEAGKILASKQASKQA